MKGGAKKAVITDEWRSGTVEERLEYSLVKVSKLSLFQAALLASLCGS